LRTSESYTLRAFRLLFYEYGRTALFITLSSYYIVGKYAISDTSSRTYHSYVKTVLVLISVTCWSGVLGKSLTEWNRKPKWPRLL